MIAQAVAKTPEEVRAALARIQERPELNDEPSLLSRALSWLMEHLFSAEPETVSTAATVVRILAVVLAGVLLGLLVVALVRRLRRRAPTSLPRAIVRARVAELRALAAEARDAGDLARALRYLLCALVIGLGQRGDLRYRDAWTNRELLDRGEPSDRVRALLAPLIAELEAKEFGREPVLAQDVARLEELCATWLGAPGAPRGDREAAA